MKYSISRAHLQRPPVIHLHRRPHILQRIRPIQIYARVIDQHVESARLASHGLGERADALVLRDIERGI